ncbi:MAG: hypothetical protein EBX99_00425 [Acidimicrobiia bacterium]|nr:hypothetical protein [Acidimicrobiia bacterium]
MKSVRVLTGTGIPLRRSDVDTDQIIPADWLKRVERTGFEVGLFSAWRIVVDMERLCVEVPSAGINESFPMEPQNQHRFLNGLDDIGITLTHADAISSFESRRPAWLSRSR